MRQATALVGLGAVAGLGLVAACSSPPSGAGQGLLQHAGPGYRVVAPSGPLTRRALESATAVPSSTMRSYLAGVRFRRAAERVWTERDGSFVTDVVVEVGDHDQAQALVSAAARVLPGPATRPFTPQGVEGGRGFLQTAQARGRTMFCVVVVLAADVRAFVVTGCTPYPQDTTAVVRLASEQQNLR